MEIFSIHSVLNEKASASLPLFYRESYNDLSAVRPIHFNYQIDKNSFMSLVVCPKQQTLISLNQSPFGTVTQSRSTVESLNKFLDYLKKYMLEHGFTELVLHHPAAIYQSHVNINLLLQHGFKIIEQEDHQFIDLKKPLKIHPMEKRKLVKLRQNKVKIRQIESNEWTVLFDFIAKSRQEKGLVINIDLPRLLQLRDRFQEQYLGWVAEDQNEWISGLITVKVTKEVVYYYLPATPDRFQKMSPMVLLLHETSIHFKQENFHYYDLGISSVGGVRQSGLYEFKSRMGADSAHRLKLQLNV